MNEEVWPLVNVQHIAQTKDEKDEPLEGRL